jgi:hypothetical protein
MSVFMGDKAQNIMYQFAQMKEEKESFTPVFNIREDKDFARIRRYLLKMFAKDAFEQLYKDFDTFVIPLNTLKEFFEKEGYNILHWLLISSKNSNVFQFMIDKIPLSILQSFIKHNNFISLKQFLRGRVVTEELEILKSQERKLDIEKFKFLLMIDRETIQQFMSENKETTLMKPSIWEDYEIALKSLSQCSGTYRFKC